MKIFQHRGFKVVRWPNGMFGSNIYLVAPEKGEGGVVIDAGGARSHVARYCKEHGVAPVYIILTHKHLDHTISSRLLAASLRMKILMGAGDTRGKSFKDGGKVLHDGDVIKAGRIELKVVATPGHTAGGISLMVGDAIFTGDTLFAKGIGRTDFRGGNDAHMASSLRKLMALPEDTVVYPGHGAETSIGHEKHRNPFIKALNRQE